MMLNNIHPRGLSKDSDVKVYSRPRATSDAIKHQINPSINRKPDVLIVHVGTNDITNDIDTITNLQTIVNRVKKKSSHSKLIISSLVQRRDKENMENKVTKLNNELKSFCDENKTTYLCNNNIDEFCLGLIKLHPNKKGKAFLAKNFIKGISETI